MNIIGSLKINNVTSGSTATEILVYNTGTTAIERRSTLPESSITFGTRLTNWNAYNSNGIVVQTSSTGWVARTITGTAGQITVTNGNGVSGNPTLALDSTFVSNSSLWQLSGTGTFNVQSTSGYSSITSTGSNNFCTGGSVSNLNTISGGDSNSILGGDSNSISSGFYNSISSGGGNTILGGDSNSILSGIGNTISDGFYNSISSGSSNTISSGSGNTISSGVSNSISSGVNNSILGGDSNSILSGFGNTISGGNFNTITGNNNNSSIIGAQYGYINSSTTGVYIGNIIIGGYRDNTNTTLTYGNGIGSFVSISKNTGTILGIPSLGSKYSTILGGNDCYIGVLNNNTSNSTYNSTIIGSQACAIYQSSTTDTSLMIYNGIYSSNNSYIRSLATASNLRTCNIIGAENSNITNNTGAQVLNNCLLNTNNVTLQNTNNTTVIGQTSTVTITESDIVYIGKEIVGGKVAVTVLSTALANTTSTTYSNIISFNAKAGATYQLRLIGTYQTAATTTGIKVRMSGTAVANVAGYMQGQIASTTGATGLRGTFSTMTSELITTGVSAINTPHSIEGNIIVRCTTAGTVILQMASEVNASSAQLNIGTSVIVERVI